jgi:hypothetical protein
MSKKQEKIEKKRKFAIWGFHDDGIWDIYIGLGIVWLGLIVLNGWIRWLAFLVIPLAAVPYLLKQKITFRRLDQIKFKKQKIRARIEFGLLIPVILVGLMMLFKDEPGINGLNQYFIKNFLVVLASFLLLTSFFLAFALNYQRLYFHGLLIFFSFFMDSLFFSKRPFGLAIWAGVIIMVAGSVALWQFVRKTPMNI